MRRGAGIEHSTAQHKLQGLARISLSFVSIYCSYIMISGMEEPGKPETRRERLEVPSSTALGAGVPAFMLFQAYTFVRHRL